jgi:CMP-N,N'-diacetyllegionaminic acid synthase
MTVVGLIPARKNSLRLPEKNWSEIGGLPLWLHAVRHANLSKACDVVAISSDDERIHYESRVAVDYHIQQPHFEQTYNVMQLVVKHADEELLKQGCDASIICLLQPTSPLRTPEDVAHCVNRISAGVDSVVSVTEGADDIAFQERHAGRLERLGPIVVPNGAVYAIRTSVLRDGGHWYGPYAYCYRMPKERSIDVDNHMDLEMARLAWRRLNGEEA